MTKTLSTVARIAVVDDHGIVRFGYSQLINQEPDMKVCGMASSEQEGHTLLTKESPELAIIDLSLKEGNGLDLIQSITKTLPQLKILAPEKLIEGIHALLQGDFFFSESVTKTLIRGRLGSVKPAVVQGLESLTNRELQVFEQIGNGHSTREIADTLFLSVKTIERHKENIKSKLHIDHATQLVRHATQWVMKRGY